MNKLGYKAMTPGNHDYNYGKKASKSRSCSFQFSANILDGNGNKVLEANFSNY